MSEKEPDFTDCPYWGMGGRYVVDPATGKRVPAIAAEDATPNVAIATPNVATATPDVAPPSGAPESDPAAQPTAQADAEADSTKSLKEKRRG